MSPLLHIYSSASCGKCRRSQSVSSYTAPRKSPERVSVIIRQTQHSWQHVSHTQTSVTQSSRVFIYGSSAVPYIKSSKSVGDTHELKVAREDVVNADSSDTGRRNKATQRRWPTAPAVYDEVA